MHHEIEGRRLALRGEMARTRSELRSEVDDLRGGLALASLAFGALRLASPRFRWISLVPGALAAVAALRARRR
jgi:hypothetical protein